MVADYEKQKKDGLHMGMIIAIVSGALMSIQGIFNSQVTKQSSLWVSSGFVQLTAFVVCLVAWAVTGRESIASLTQVHPKYMLLGGVMGAFITITVIQAMSSLGPARATMLIVVAQLLVSYLVELFGLFGVNQVEFDWKKLLGMALAVGGIILFKWE